MPSETKRSPVGPGAPISSSFTLALAKDMHQLSRSPRKIERSFAEHTSCLVNIWGCRRLSQPVKSGSPETAGKMLLNETPGRNIREDLEALRNCCYRETLALLGQHSWFQSFTLNLSLSDLHRRCQCKKVYWKSHKPEAPNYQNGTIVY